MRGCSTASCTNEIDLTDVMVKDVLVSSHADEDIKREVLCWSDLDGKSLRYMCVHRNTGNGVMKNSYVTQKGYQF